ncbi:MAG: hypothetical protein ACE366_13420 [Bradymonadia bacterium]
MDAHLINKLLSSTGAILAERMESGSRPGRPFSREAALTPYEYNVLVTLKQEGARPLEFMVSTPAMMADALVGNSDAAPGERLAALAELAQSIAKKAVEHLDPGTVDVEMPRGVVGWDITVPSLRQTARRICVPFDGEAGSLIVEAGVHT